MVNVDPLYFLIFVSFYFVSYKVDATREMDGVTLVVLIHEGDQDKCFVCLPMIIFCNGEAPWEVWF